MTKLGKMIENKLFEGFNQEDIPALLKLLEARTRHYEKGQYIAFQGEPLTRAGLVLSGRVRIQKETDASVFVINEYTEGSLFGEALSFVKNAVTPFNILAAAKTEILFLNLLRANENGIFAENLIKLLAERVLFFNRKLDVLSSHNIRGRLLSFFEYYYALHGDKWFDCPYDRNTLAEFLSVNRSALSREISNMKRDGIIKTDKNKFKILLPLFKKV